MRGAKPSSGLVHLHKSFVELHFSSRPLPQNVSVVACVDGKALDTVLPGQVYATNGQDHWLLGLQFIFKAYKEPVITHVDKTADSTVTVAIATQGLQDKYCSAEPARRAELQRAVEAAALKFAQTAVMRKEGRLQISGPNINIPKKQLRAQWPAILQRLAPQDVTAHIFVDSADSYIACAAKIILTKAKAEPVFYLSGLSQLLKSFSGSFVTLELLPEQQVAALGGADEAGLQGQRGAARELAGAPQAAQDNFTQWQPLLEPPAAAAAAAPPPAAAAAAGAAAAGGWGMLAACAV
ncbi:hypothetical protein OEZ86_000902 [Tetradesmus obliquus]|nr:hypothetical protein OEZ86_000902 [Tetradesmus obliquus]